MDFTFVSAGAFSLTGYHPSEFSFDSPIDITSLILPDDLNKAIELRQTSLLLKNKYECEYRIKHKNGDVKWVVDTGFGRYDENGHLTTIEGYMQERTRNHNANQLNHDDFLRLKEIETILNFENVIVVKWRNESGWPIEFVSQNMLENLGYHPSDVYNGNIKTNSIIHPADYKKLKELALSQRDNFKNELNTQFRIRTKWDEYKWFECYIKLASEKSEFNHIYAILIDVSNKKLSDKVSDFNENLLNTIFNTGPNALILVDPATKRITKCNRPSIEMFDYTNELELIGTYFPSLQKQQTEDDFLETLDSKLNSQSEWTGAIEFTSKSNRIFQGQIVVRRFQLQNINFELIHITDITENLRNLNTIQQYAEKLRELNFNREKFFSIIAHDLRSPFNSILGFSSILKGNVHEFETEIIEKYVGLIHEASIRTYSLLENLLEWSRSQTGQISFSPKNISITELFNEQLAILNENIKAKNLSIISNYHNIEAYADQNMLMVIIRNLLSNAIKFSNPYSKLKLCASNTEQQTIISISDEGTGMSNERLATIFSPNNISTETGTMGEKGTGLGLMLCKEFTEKHGGTIDVESTLGKGSVFTIKLPKDRV
jgi:signal transduction histidine kinase